MRRWVGSVFVLFLMGCAAPVEDPGTLAGDVQLDGHRLYEEYTDPVNDSLPLLEWDTTDDTTGLFFDVDGELDFAVDGKRIVTVDVDKRLHVYEEYIDPSNFRRMTCRLSDDPPTLYVLYDCHCESTGAASACSEEK